MAKVVHIDTQGLLKYVVCLGLQNSGYELTTISFLENLDKQAEDSDLVILGRDMNIRNDGWKIAEKLAKKEIKVLVISDSPPPKRYSKIEWVDDEKLFFKEINLREIVNLLLNPK